MQDLMDAALALDSGQHLIWQIDRGLLSPLYLPEPQKLLTLPPGNPRWRVFELNIGPQQTQNITVNFGRRSWILAITGSFLNEAGFKATFMDAWRKRNIFGNTREYIANLVGTGSKPAWLVTPYEMEPNTPLFGRITNLATATATGEIAIYCHEEAA
jgi:hypothetical protein